MTLDRIEDYRYWKMYKVNYTNPNKVIHGQQFRAERFGVAVYGSTLENTKKYVDQRIKDYPWEGRETVTVNL